jgi:MATE family multidrug resistance protein
MGTAAALYVFAPDIFLKPFAAQADAQTFADIRPIAVVALRFIAVFSLFDVLNIMFSAALKGAGDTRYIMFVVFLASSVALVLPSYVALVLLDADIVVGWSILTVYVVVLSFAYLHRFLGGKWKSMRVIEGHVATSTPTSLRPASAD